MANYCDKENSSQHPEHREPCQHCQQLEAEVATLRRMLDYSQDQEAKRATRAGELWAENYELKLRLRDVDQLELPQEGPDVPPGLARGKRSRPG